MSRPILEIKDPKIQFQTRQGVVKAVDGGDLAIGRGETVEVVFNLDYERWPDRIDRGCLQPVGLTPRRENRSQNILKLFSASQEVSFSIKLAALQASGPPEAEHLKPTCTNVLSYASRFPISAFAAFIDPMTTKPYII